MLTIGSIYKSLVDGQARICADISLNGRGITLWFGVDAARADYLCHSRSDAFVMALLPTAMRGGHDIVCQTPMSERLHYQLENYLMPTLGGAGELYRSVRITAPLTSEKLPTAGGVATGFSGGVDSLYSIMTHSKDSAYPLTHIAVFNSGVWEADACRVSFPKACAKAEEFARQQGLIPVLLDTNLPEALPERYIDVCCYRLLACALALQGGFSVYLLSSSWDLKDFTVNLRKSEGYEYLLLHCAQTESLCIYNEGIQVTRNEKTKALSRWEPAHRWLHFCIFGHAGEKNCGRCKKCAREITTLYAYGALDEFDAVLDLQKIRQTLPRQLALVLANRKDKLYGEAADLLEHSGVPIPEAAYVYAQQFAKAMNNLREEQK